MVGRYSMSPAPAYAFDLDGTLADCSHRLRHIVRAPGDTRPKDWRAFFASVGDDDVVKPELFTEAERDGYRIVQAFEDRARVVDALRAAGYAVAQVAEGRF